MGNGVIGKKDTSTTRQVVKSRNGAPALGQSRWAPASLATPKRWHTATKTGWRRKQRTRIRKAWSSARSRRCLLWEAGSQFIVVRRASGKRFWASKVELYLEGATQNSRADTRGFVKARITYSADKHKLDKQSVGNWGYLCDDVTEVWKAFIYINNGL